MLGQHTTSDGFVLTAWDTLYLSYGLTISKDGKELFSNPHCLSIEAYGSKPSAKYEDWDEAMEASENGDDDAFVAWDADDWQKEIAEAADSLIEAYIVENNEDN